MYALGRWQSTEISLLIPDSLLAVSRTPSDPFLSTQARYAARIKCTRRDALGTADHDDSLSHRPAATR